jgi:hypothetical protein
VSALEDDEPQFELVEDETVTQETKKPREDDEKAQTKEED